MRNEVKHLGIVGMIPYRFESTYLLNTLNETWPWCR